jgi:hypothetical protein
MFLQLGSKSSPVFLGSLTCKTAALFSFYIIASRRENSK